MVVSEEIIMSGPSVKLGSINQPRQMTNLEAAYWAGMLDGEGSICVARATMADQNRPQFRLVLSVANTNFEVLHALMEMVGVGGISRKMNHSAKWKDSGQLVINSEGAAYCIAQVAPYLIIKSEQAALALKFIELKRAWSRQNDNWPEQQECYRRMRALNARGKGNETPYEFKRADKVERTCSFDGCEALHYGNGYCRRHYRWTTSKIWESRSTRRCQQCETELPASLNLAAKFCSVSCKMKFHRAKGCYSPEAQTGARKCSVGGCDRVHQAKGMCRRHYMQQWHASQSAH